MTLDWTHFAPYPAFLGGVLIGLAAVAFVLASRRILGVSGIVGGLLRPIKDDVGWRLAFLVGLIGAPAILHALYDVGPAASYPTYGALIAGGFLVGIGTSLANGCTSGHGVCGLSRQSRRSLVATVTFKASAVVTVFITHHLAGG
jgi:uncharacterized membrane protein YedE/YeeE